MMMMQQLSHHLRHFMQLTAPLLTLVVDAMRFLRLCLRLHSTLAVENLFLRQQLALYQERHAQSRRATNAPRLTLVWLGHWCDWRKALGMVTPQTFTRWHCQGFWLFWRWQSRGGQPRIPAELQALIRQMAQDNPTWSQERIANELLLKLGLRVLLHTLRKYMPPHLVQGHGKRVPSQRWWTLRHHASGDTRTTRMVRDRTDHEGGRAV